MKVNVLRNMGTIRFFNWAISGRYNLNQKLWKQKWVVRLFGPGRHLLFYTKYDNRKD